MSEAITRERREGQALPPIPERAHLGMTVWTLLRWTMAQTGAMMPLFIVVQAAIAGAVVVGFGLLVPDIDAPTAELLSTGAPTILILVIGLVLCPWGVAGARTSGTLTYQRALPVPRPLLLVADLVVWLVIALPSIPVTVLVARLRYGIEYSIDWPLLVGAFVLATIMAVSVGYATAMLLSPMMSQLVSQVMVFFVMLFSPVTFPKEQLPEWFQAVHSVLPFQAAADLLRAGLLSDRFEPSGQGLVVLIVWCLLGLIISVRAVIRRG
ncbi:MULTISPECIES: ABC transporter permease [Nocardiopsis]|jgi:ABC-2 type transport system permease protein|uniref:ABC transporter permease n=2 Tax=Nocardiopsis alba TaxID=53437 RepID=A0A7K2ISW2_9ACTN|nr:MULTISPECIES: ABC transporter permease [Nocardiopsis]AFR09004.1 ABC-2 type transporter family protein [Nocardiopsis alba ATCC BAA-2165]MEC3893366.1 ABC transporter permease [Nocardiopsis sp. LDBS1602]MYR32976.1 ABC transporter permease [Nocardiopsis alba]